LSAFKELYRMTRHDGGNSVFVNELGMAIAAQQHAEIIEPRDDALQLYAVHQENGERNFVFADVVEKIVLKVLCAAGCHGRWCRSWAAGPCPTAIFGLLRALLASACDPADRNTLSRDDH